MTYMVRNTDLGKPLDQVLIRLVAIKNSVNV